MRALSSIRLVFLFMMVWVTQAAMGQVNVTIRVLPPYQSRITEYASRPDLMLLSLTNTSGTAQRVQLTASISGDNGIAAWVKPGYRSPQPIELAPGQALNLNGSDIAFLFDHNQIQYTGISQSDFTRGSGLPEGTYQLCVRALDYDTQEPISPEEPMGCTQFIISSVEPPTILQPFNEQELRADGPQAFPITWSTPPGSSPLTQYKVKMVEMIAPRNPNDAMQSATTPPFFEETVNANMLLYGPQYPQLTPGRQYALMVQAVDPYGTTYFRNRGMSEVVMFTYGQSGSVTEEVAAAEPVNTASEEPELAYATHRVTGKLVWAFKRSEQQYKGVSRFSVLQRAGAVLNTSSTSHQLAYTNLAATSVSASATAAAVFNAVSKTPNLVSHYLSYNPVQAAKSVSLAQVDPTLSNRFIASPVVSSVANSPSTATPAASELFSAGGASTLNYTYEMVQVDTADERFPLANVTLTIRGIKSGDQVNPVVTTTTAQSPVTQQQDISWSGLRTFTSLQNMLRSALVSDQLTNAIQAQTPTVSTVRNLAETNEGQALGTILATARTDAAGHFTLQLIDPAYEGQQYDRLVVAVQAEGFEALEYPIALNTLHAQASLELGELVMLAKTYRLNPKVKIQGNESGLVPNPGMRVNVYRTADDIALYPFLQQEGNLSSEARVPVVINGKRYVPVAADSVSGGEDPAESFEFGFGKLFYSGSLYVEIEGLAGNVEKKSTTIRITDNPVLASRILVAKPEYSSNLKKPSVSGQVVLQAGENMVPVAGAVVQVTYNKDDVQGGTVAGGALAGSRFLETAEVRATALLTANRLVSGTLAITNQTSSATNPLTLSAVFAQQGVSKPVAITASTSSSITGLASSSVLSYATKNIVVAPSVTGGLANTIVANNAATATFVGAVTGIVKQDAYTVTTDSTGNYLIGNLPLLKEGAHYTVTLVSVPNNFRGMAVTPGKEQTFSAVKGAMETRSFTISPEIYNMVGRVIGVDKQGIANARLHFKGGTTYFDTGEGGLFQTSYYAGDHILIVEKEGYTTLEVPVRLSSAIDQGVIDKIKEANDKRVIRVVVKPGDAVMNLTNPVTWVQSVQQTNTVKNAVTAGQLFSPAMFGVASSVNVKSLALPAFQGGLLRGPHGDESDANAYAMQQLNLVGAFATQINTTFRLNEYAFASSNTADLGDIGPLLPKVGKVKFLVVNKLSGAPIEGVQIQLFDTAQVTDNQGTWLYEGLGGQATVTITPPVGSGLVALQKVVQIEESGKETFVRIEVERGTRVFGSVRSGSEALAGASIRVEGRDYLRATADEQGNYELVMPEGEQVFRAAKSGYLAKVENRTLPASGELELNFDLESGGGRNLSTLLGFEIELDRIEGDGDGERWTGRFVNLKPISSIFKNASNVELAFNDIRVTFDVSGNAVPREGAVTTDVSSIPLKLFGFLPVVLQGDGQLKVTGDAQNNGRILGKLQLDVNRIPRNAGFNFPTDHPLFVGLQDGAEAADVEVFRASESPGTPTVRFKLAKEGDTKAKLGLYGFSLEVDLAASVIGTDGLTLAGKIQTPALGPISSAEITIEEFSISNELRVKTVSVNSDNLPSLKIAGWSAALSSLIFNENGLKIGGRLTFSIPQSGESTLDFANLSLGKDALYGGQFSFPGSGISIYNIVNLQSGGKSLSFGRVGNTQVYYLSGSARMKFDKLITKEITIPSFQVQTDGRFMVEAPVNYSADLSFAKFKISSLTVSTLSGQAPFISVQGEFGVNFPGLKFNVADIKFTANASGGTSFSVGTIGGELSVAVLKVGVTVGLQEYGFSGGGSLSLPGTPINAEVNFEYANRNNQLTIGASFKAGVSIPIGIVEITRVGGGFRYEQATNRFMVEINGGATITGMRALVELNPISLKIESQGIVTGHVGVVVGTALRLVDAYVTLNVPGKFFAIQVNSNIEPIKGVASARMNGLLRIKWDPNDKYVFLGVNTEIDLLGLVKNYGEYALGINIWDPKYREDDIAGYFRYLDDDLYAAGDDYWFSGVYLHTKSEIGIKKNKAWTIDAYIASGKMWFGSTSEVMLILNFASNQYGFKLAGSLEAGIEVCALPWDLACIGTEFGACYAFFGGFNEGDGWYLGGKAGGYFSAHVGKKCGCNSVCFIGGRVCIYAHASISIRTRGGVNFGVGLGSENDNNLCQ